MQKAEQLIPPQNTKRRGLFEAEKTLLALRQGQLSEVRRWVNNQTDLKPTAEHERERLILARAFLANNEPQDALAFIDDLTALAEEAGRVKTVIEARLIKALALEQTKNEDKALDVFTEALSLAESEGFIRLFIDEAEAVRPLLQRALAAGHHASYVSKLLTSFGKSENPESSTSRLLTRRELEILTLIAEGYSNQAIAEKLIRSVGTIKGHTSTIYSKLGVENRIQAIERARELELLAVN